MRPQARLQAQAEDRVPQQRTTLKDEEPLNEIEWAVIATDGASDILGHLGYDWHAIAHQDDDQLRRLLAHAHEWEERHDPHGQRLPRAKRHDDKSIAAVQLDLRN